MKTITHAVRMELANAVRDRYLAATNKDKRQILDEFIAVTGYHEKSAIRVLNSRPESKRRQTRQRPSLYDEAARGALIVLWEASDRVCGKRLKALLPILLPALERNGHLTLETELRSKILSMSAATIDRLLKTPRGTATARKPRKFVPELRRRVKMRTFADWNEPLPGSMEMDLVAHCGNTTRGNYVHSLVLTDIASGWTEAAPIVVREGTLVVETLERIRVGLPFAGRGQRQRVRQRQADRIRRAATYRRGKSHFVPMLNERIWVAIYRHTSGRMHPVIADGSPNSPRRSLATALFGSALARGVIGINGGQP